LVDVDGKELTSVEVSSKHNSKNVYENLQKCTERNKDAWNTEA
jgi:hypothetical protein